MIYDIDDTYKTADQLTSKTESGSSIVYYGNPNIQVSIRDVSRWYAVGYIYQLIVIHVFSFFFENRFQFHTIHDVSLLNLHVILGKSKFKYKCMSVIVIYNYWVFCKRNTYDSISMV